MGRQPELTAMVLIGGGVERLRTGPRASGTEREEGAEEPGEVGRLVSKEEIISSRRWRPSQGVARWKVFNG